MKNFILKGGNIISSLENEIEKDNKGNRQKRENGYETHLRFAALMISLIRKRYLA